MAEHDEAAQRAEQLVEKSLQQLAQGHNKDAHQNLQQAIHLAPDNTSVREAFAKLQLADQEAPLLRLCRDFAVNGNEAAGKEAAKLARSDATLPASTADNCVQHLLSHGVLKHQVIQEDLLSSILHHSEAAKRSFAAWIREGVLTSKFRVVFGIGDGVTGSLTQLCINSTVWPDDTTRIKYEEDIFRLLLAKSLEAGDDNQSRALKGIARLLVTDGSRLCPLIDAISFDAFLACLDYRSPTAVKSPATLAVAKCLEHDGFEGKKHLTDYVTTHYARQTAEDLIAAFSVAASVFPIATPIAASMFLSEGFLQTLVPLLEKKKGSKCVVLAALEMLNAACVDSTCRQSISKHCVDWLQSVSALKETPKSSLSSVVLAKLEGTPGQKNDTTATGSLSDVDSLVHRLTQMLFEDPKTNRDAVFEGLAHQSVRPVVKEQLVKDRKWLQVFMQEFAQVESGSPAMFGGLIILQNLTAYLPVLSEEEKKMAQLKAYANSTPDAVEPDPLNEDSAVSRRCVIVVKANAVATLVNIYKNATPASLAILVQIMLSLTRTPKLRGNVSQQGGVKLLVQSWARLDEDASKTVEAKQNAAQALARLLISLDPSILFSPTGNALLSAALPPLLSLVQPHDGPALSGPRNLLPTFEALLALTNLCSMPSNGASAVVLKHSRAAIEDLVLGNNSRIRRAATELMSNLVQSPEGIVLFADGSPEAARRLHIFLALADADDLATRKAAGGALATLTEFAEVTTAINKQDRGMELLMAMLDDDSEEMIHRGVVCVTNVANCEGEPGRTARQRSQELGVMAKLQQASQNATNRNILALIAEAVAVNAATK